MEIQAFLGALWRHWKPLMSCLAFTCLSVLSAISQRGNTITVVGTGILAVLFFGVSAHGAWKDERDEKSKAIEKLEERRPRIAFLVTETRSHKWLYINDIFSVTHLGGDAAQYVQIQPIQSAAGKRLFLKFGEIPYLDKDRKQVSPGFDLSINESKNEADRINNLIYVFLHGDTQHKSEVEYPVTVKFKWKSEWLEEHVI